MGKINKSMNGKSRDKNGLFISEKQRQDINNNDDCDCYGLPILPHEVVHVKLDHAYVKKTAPLQVIDLSSAPVHVHETPTIDQPTETVG